MEKKLILPGNTVTGNMMLDRRSLEKSHFYNDGLIHQDIRDVVSSGLWGQEPDSPKLILSFYRDLKSADFAEPDHAKVSALVDHLNRAITISWKLGVLGQKEGLSQSLLDGLNQSIFLLDAQRRIIHTNAVAQRLLSDRIHLVTVRHGCLIGLGIESNPSLDEAMKLANQGFSIPIAFTHIKDSQSVGIGGAHLLRLTEPSGWLLDNPKARYALIIEPGNRVDHASLAALGKLFKLTTAEQTVLLHLMQEATPEEIAVSLGISVHTVRTQIKSLREKTGVRRITELVHMALAATRAP
jgi:DNA-binding CsgD family transcriptional regulator